MSAHNTDTATASPGCLEEVPLVPLSVDGREDKNVVRSSAGSSLVPVSEDEREDTHFTASPGCSEEVPLVLFPGDGNDGKHEEKEESSKKTKGKNSKRKE